MTRLPLPSLTFGILLCIGSAPASAAAQSQSSGLTFPEATGTAPVFTPDMVEPDAVEALRAMSTYLMSLKTIGITSQGSLDVVTGEGQRIQLDGTTTYKIRRPGFVIDYVSDIKDRRFIYDGKTFTIYSPKLGFDASEPATATNKEALNVIYEKFGVKLPLEDLFRWADPNGLRQQSLRSAYRVGPATINGTPTDHYAFREDEVDWELWIQKGDQPLPRKLVIVDRTAAAHPTFSAHLSWTVNPAFTDSDFAFVPDKDAKRIQMATFKGSGQ